MGLFDFFHAPDINAGVKEWAGTPGAVLLDVRTPAEYASGHIEGSLNVPLDSLGEITNAVKERGTPIFVHCLSGARSRQAEAILVKMGFTNVKNIGGISAWKGKVV